MTSLSSPPLPVISAPTCHLRSYLSSPRRRRSSARHSTCHLRPYPSSPRRRRSSAPTPTCRLRHACHLREGGDPAHPHQPVAYATPVISTKVEIQRNDIYVGILNCPCSSQLPVNLSVVVPTFLSCLCGSQLRFLQVKFHIRILIQIVNNTSSATDPVRNQACLT